MEPRVVRQASDEALDWEGIVRVRGEKRAVSFGWSLLLNMSAGVVLLGGALLISSMVATERTLQRLSKMLISGVTKTTSARLESFFEPVESELAVGAERWETGAFREWDLAVLDEYFKPVVDSLPQVSSLMLATDGGSEYMLLKTGGMWKSRLTGAGVPVDSASPTGQAMELWREWAPGSPAPAGIVRPTEYDCRSRTWFTGAREAYSGAADDAEYQSQIYWTEPYKFFTTKEPGVTASLEFELRDGSSAVLGLDVLLTDISHYTTKMEIGEFGVAFVIRGDPDDPTSVGVIGLPAEKRFLDLAVMNEHILQSPEVVGGPLGAFAREAFARAALRESEPERFESDGEDWWGAISRSRIKSTDPLWVGAVVPERQLHQGFPDVRKEVIIVTLIMVVIACFASRRLARGYGRPIGGLVRAGERMQRLDFEPHETVRSRVTEIRQLASTLEEMRVALRSHTAVREDVRIARSVREQMALPGEIRDVAGVEIATWHASGDPIGGESFDVLRRRDEVLVVSFDAAGNGVLPVIYGVALRGVFRTAVRCGADLAHIAEKLHVCVRCDLPSPCRVPTWLGSLDVRTGELRYLSFGHVGAVVVLADESRLLTGGGPIIGDGDRFTLPKLRRILLPQDAVLAVVSDGVVETTDEERRRLRAEGVARVVRDSAGEDLQTVLGSLCETLSIGTESADDRSIVLVRRTG